MQLTSGRLPVHERSSKSLITMSAKIFNLTGDEIFVRDSAGAEPAAQPRSAGVERHGFTGAISLPVLPDLIQVYTTAMTTGALTIRRGLDTGTIWIDRGSMVHAVCGDLSGEEAVYRLLEWRDGEFSLDAGTQAPARTIAASWQAVLMEGCRRLDEAGAAISATVFETTRFGDGPADRFDELLETIESSHEAVLAGAIFDATGQSLAHRSRALGLDLSGIGPAVSKVVAEQSRVMEAIGQQAPLQDLLTILEDQLHLITALPEGRFLYLVSDRSDTNLALLRRAVERAVGRTT